MPLNAPFSMEVTESGTVAFVMSGMSWKANISMDTTPSGIESSPATNSPAPILETAEQPEKE